MNNSHNKKESYHPSKSQWLRKWSRLLHRDLSFFFAGMILIYAISGLILNHRHEINPHYTVSRQTYLIDKDLSDLIRLKEEKKTANEKKSPKVNSVANQGCKDIVLSLLKPLGEEGNLTKYYFPTPTQLKVFLKGGSSLVVQLDTKEAVYEQLKRRPLLSSMVQLHFNPGKWWTWFADSFAIGLIIITLSGMYMLPVKKGILGRGGFELIIGMLIPLLFLFFFK